MEPHTRRDQDVDSALDLIIGDTPAQPVGLPVVQQRKKDKESNPPNRSRNRAGQGTPSAIVRTGERAKARTGRPPGAKSRPARLKDKTSLAIDLELMDRYRKQSWKEECQLGELIERALRDYARQTWDWTLD